MIGFSTARSLGAEFFMQYQQLADQMPSSIDNSTEHNLWIPCISSCITKYIIVDVTLRV